MSHALFVFIFITHLAGYHTPTGFPLWEALSGKLLCAPISFFQTTLGVDNEIQPTSIIEASSCLFCPCLKADSEVFYGGQ